MMMYYAVNYCPSCGGRIADNESRCKACEQEDEQAREQYERDLDGADEDYECGID
jgi:tRNA(Ile2) C34 agmatinyltransferase TiaS